MKQLLTILAFLILSMSTKAQDIYSVGHYNVNNGTIAALYKNNERLYTAHITGMTSKAFKVVCNSEGDVFWLVNHYNNNSLERVEIRKNDQVYASMEDVDVIHINDMYCLNDTVYYAGYQLNENGVAIATVWKGEDFATHWVLGNRVHASVIFDADVDKSTGIPYFCGYVNDSVQNAIVWEGSQLLYKLEPAGYRHSSWANEISVDNGSVYTNGYVDYSFGGDVYTKGTIWKDNELIHEVSDEEFLGCLYAQQGDYYYTLDFPHGMYYGVYKNRVEFLHLPYQAMVQRICGDSDDIYMVGSLQELGTVWKNFEVYLQPNNCSRLYDMVVSYANVGIDEPDEGAFAVYPNPTNGILFVEMRRATSLPEETPYRITNIMGQTVLSGNIAAETQQINIASLPAGMYFIIFAGETRKFVVK